MAEVLMDFPQLTMTLPDGREESIMKRTTLARPSPAPALCFGCACAANASAAELLALSAQ